MRATNISCTGENARQSSDACAIRQCVASASQCNIFTLASSRSLTLIRWFRATLPPTGDRYVSAGVAEWTATLYGAEVALHEALLASEHRVRSSWII